MPKDKKSQHTLCKLHQKSLCLYGIQATDVRLGGTGSLGLRTDPVLLHVELLGVRKSCVLEQNEDAISCS